MNETHRTELDALEILMQDHREIESLMSDVEHLKGADQDEALARLLIEIRVHHALESEVFYPAVTAIADNAELRALIDEAAAERATIVSLATQVEHAGARDARVADLTARIERHVLRNEELVFPLAKSLGETELRSIARAMRVRRAGLMSEVGVDESDAVAV